MILLTLTGCALQKPSFNDDSNMMANAMQPVNNATSPENNQRMIVVTVSDELHEKITGGIPINMVSADGAVPPPHGYLQFLRDLKNKYGVQTVADWPLDSLGVRCFIFEIQKEAERDTVINRLRLDKRIETAQPMQTFSVLGESYNDPYLKLQHNFKSLGISKSHQWATGKGITVAIIDTGTDLGHEDLKTQVSGKRNFVDENNQTFRKDKHGTAVSGVIAAKTNNATGMVGIAPDAKVFPMKACWEIQSNSDKAQCSSFTLAKAINFAIGQAVDIINLSLAGPDDPLLQRLILRALEKNITVVAATSQNKNRNFPATMPGVLAVSKSESKTSKPIQRLLHAPGEKVLSTIPGDQYDFFSGSSFSTAQVSGLVALIKQRKPHLSNEKIYSTLKSSEPLFRNTQIQNSSVNGCTALAKIIGTVCH